MKMSIQKDGPFLCAVSIRRADYWLVEERRTYREYFENKFQSAGRIIGWLKKPYI